MQLIIFDIDGTLASTDYEKDMCFANAFEQVLGRSVVGLDFESCAHVTDSAITDHFFQQMYGRNALPQEVEDLKRTFRIKLEEKHKTNPELFLEIPGAAAIFNQLRQQNNVMLGISTGAWKLPASFKLEVIKLQLDNVVFYGADEHHSKQHSISRVIQDSKQATGREQFERITYIGDRIYDMETSRQLGIEFLGIDHKNTGVLQRAGAPVVLPNYQDTNRFLEAFDLN